ncbi:stage III sporulation protein AF [Enterocloster lavalensis]|uniref:stage III sporulation protein AF n=1 Tax=Enterocloster lavalensis TaxID=460384 RepID=UPI0023F12197|nr:stage III sporulation protein AF [Enterocloster lavalensis]
MTAVYEWVRNITYYMIFITVVGNLLADSKYEKYLRFFAGIILILLVLKPLTGSLRLDERIAYLFESISFQKEADDFKEKLWGMEDERLERVMSTYEEAVAMDIRGMADTAGFSVRSVKVTIETDRDSPLYGHVTDLYMKLGRQKEENAAGGGWNTAGGIGGSAAGNSIPSSGNSGLSAAGSESADIQIEPQKIQVEPVQIGSGAAGAPAEGGSGDPAVPAPGASAVIAPGDLAAAPGDLAAAPGDPAATPGDLAAAPGDPAAAPGDPAATAPGAPAVIPPEASRPLTEEEAVAAAVEQSQILARTFPANLEERTKINAFIRKVAGYYGLETAHVQVEWEDD